MPVRSIITSPMNGASFGKNVREIKLRGAAWAGDLTVRRVDISIDYGATWRPAQLSRPKNPYDWQRWTKDREAAERGLFRDLDPRDRFSRPHAAAHRRKLEPARLWRQSDASGGDPDRMTPE